MLARFDISRSQAPIVSLNPVQREALDKLNQAVVDRTITFQPLPCPLCGGEDFEQIASRDRYGVPCDTVVCRGCSMLQTNPYPDDRSLTWFYSNVFGPLHRGTDQPTDAKFRDRRRYAPAVLEWLDRHQISITGAVVDVGCSSGGILRGFEDAGLVGVGIEIDPVYAADGRSRGVDVRVGTLDTVDLPEDLGLVTYIHVLEHIVDVNAELERLARVVGRQALVLIEVPGLTSVPSKYRYDTLGMLQLAHAWHFAPETLKALFAKHGFVCLAIDDTVRGLFRFDPEAAQRQSTAMPGAAAVVQRIRTLERQRILHWKTWARRARALWRGR